MLAIKLILEGLGLGLDKKQKWIMGTAGMAVISAALAGIMAVIL